MAIITIPYKGTDILQEDQNHQYFTSSDTEGAIFEADTEDTNLNISSSFMNTCHPQESSNTSWISVKTNWERTTNTSPADFTAKFTLYGIPVDGGEQLIGEEYITTCSSPGPTTEDLIFDLKGCGGCAPVHKTGYNSETAGTFKLELPMLYENYYSISMGYPWLEGWTYRKPVTVAGYSDGTYETLKDFPVEVIIDYETGKMNTDFSDIRFTTNDGQTGLCYWIKYKVNSSFAVAVVKMPKYPKSYYKSTLYMYYGNASATPTTSISAVSSSYEDCSGDTSKWTHNDSGGSNLEIVSGYLRLADNSGDEISEAIMKDPIKYPNTILEMYGKIDGVGKSTGYSRGIFITQHETRTSTLLESGEGHMLYVYATPPAGQTVSYRAYSGGSPSGATTSTPYADGQWIIVRAEVNDSKGITYKLYSTTSTAPLDTINSILNPTTPYTHYYVEGQNYRHYFGVGAYNCTLTTAWYSMRQSAATPPAITVGTEMTTPYTYITPTSTGDQYVIFSTPSDWAESGNVFFRVEEYNQSEYYTPTISVSAQNTLALKYDGVDRYPALRLKYEGIHDNTYDVKISSVEYTYEV